MTNQSVIVEVVQETDPMLLRSLNDLLPQLSKNAQAMTMEDLKQIVDSECSDLLVVRAAGGGSILGAFLNIR
ncbi:hypothetical protein [Pseudomonas mandelii]|uniref:hypothetical protein n=1 Tax=Pseudomonas mandelii TaxID=75612 RepID=UPI00209F4287|nr:hypothetical protein [Pseudomonas mandelii]MCO8311801.1 hypothetical protein [Pseudomonas mandelii]